ncbi:MULTISPECIES: hypothetical protein [Mycobacteroides]|uniref:hypothetical protein n=1 Tax=Mycobacteroides TaxID=670516 RepID=UPI0008A87C4A|nr:MULTISPECIES: hypothetical protein [Mycobacteroides]AYM40325.1 hypothetical protein DYE20_01075 [[Mycobacterium] chelonae subsp. gwanakae]OHU15909.1 hypothetical protein BKG75_12740 [Mycobacteroides chelonae]SIF26095.1 Uncharacterised protein [Mycobacteroides abscessus subsp. abscessus]SIF39143.1 Uncharacterised protein [Mycobacteroides abscessus subsp. abscessus]SIF83063.1 Uncharacterised protein [Mycobacteroides abscessus subsp. abscessus]
MKIPIPITAAGLAITAAVALTGCAPGPETGAAPSSSGQTRVAGTVPVANFAFVNGRCAGIITMRGDSWVLPDGGAGPLKWAPDAVASGCDDVALPGQTAAPTTTSTGARTDIPDSAPAADYTWVADRCTQVITLANGSVWAMPPRGFGPLTQVTEPAFGGCKIMPTREGN